MSVSTVKTMDVSFKMDGLDAVIAKMKNLSHETQYKGGRTALRKASEVVQGDALARAKMLDDPKTREQIYKNLVIRWNGRLFKRTGDLAFRIGILGGARPSTGYEAVKSRRRRRKAGIKSLFEMGQVAGKGKENPGGDTFYWRFLEYGTKKIDKKEFMQPALRSKAQDATNEFVKQFDKAIDRAIKRGAK